MREETTGKETLVSLTSPHLRATFTTLGGRLKSLTDLRSNRELIQWAPGEGGWLDDRDARTMSSYTFQIEEKKAHKIVLSFFLKDDAGFLWKKEITIDDTFPGIRVKWTITNTQTSSREFSQMVRNFIVPRSEMICGYHNSTGIQQTPWANWNKQRSQSLWIKDIAAPWVSLIVPQSKDGIAIACNELATLYFWAVSPRGTLEWVYPTKTLAQGESIVHTADIILLHGLENIVTANSEYTLSMDYREDVKQFSFTNLLNLHGKKLESQPLSLSTKILSIQRKPLVQIDAPLTPTSSPSMLSSSIEWKAPADGIYILQQELLHNTSSLASFETPIIAGFADPSITYLHPDFIPPRKLLNLAITAEEIKQGYFFHLPSEENMLSIATLEADLAMEEEEYIELNGTFFKNPGRITISANTDKQFPGLCEIWVEDNYRLIQTNSFLPRPGEKNAVWIRLGSKNLASGSYTIPILFSAEDGTTHSISCKITVWPVQIEASEYPMVRFFWSSLECIFSELFPKIKNDDQRLTLWKKVLSDMAKAGQTILEVRPHQGTGIMDKYVRVTHFSDKGLPKLDTSKWEPFLQAAVKAGMKHAVFQYRFYNKAWLPPNFNTFSDSEKEEIEFHLLKQIIEALQKQGLKRIFFYLIDELDPSPEKINAICARMDKLKARFPILEFAGSGFAGTPIPAMQTLSQRLSWIAPYWSVHTLIERLGTQEIPLLPNAIAATQLSGDFKRGYTTTKKFLWQCWKAGLTGYQIYGYHTFYPKYQYSCVFPGPEGPIPSPTLWGLIDGREEYLLLRMLDAKVKNQAGEDPREKIVGEKNAILGWNFISSSSFIYPEITGDDHAFRQAKKEVLRILSEKNPLQ